jgi:hypothetical protein
MSGSLTSTSTRTPSLLGRVGVGLPSLLVRGGVGLVPLPTGERLGMGLLNASSQPSPPSLTGIDNTSASGILARIPSTAARLASIDVRQPLNESMATMILPILTSFILILQNYSILINIGEK